MRKKNDSMNDLEQSTDVSLSDFVTPSKIAAFCNKYKPADHWIAMFLPTISFAPTSRQWCANLVTLLHYTLMP